MAVLPKEINYAERLSSLPPNTSNLSVVVSPANGQTFGAGGDVIQFDLPSRGYLVPESLYIRFKQTTTGANADPLLRGTPAYTPFARLETIIGGQVVESIQQYNQLANILVNTKMSIAQKVGMAASLGYIDNGGGVAPTFINVDGATLAQTADTAQDYAAPLGCLLSNAEHLVPLGMMPGCRIQLTTDSLTNMFVVPANTTAWALSNLELCFDVVDFGEEVNMAVMSMADEDGNIFIKSQSYTSASQNLPTGTGQTELVFNQRLSSIKSILANFAGGAANQTNGIFDSVDVSRGSGDYQFLIASEQFPPRPLSVSQNKGGVYQELADTWSVAHDLYHSNMAITPLQFAALDNTATTNTSPAKFYVGTNTERLSTNNALLTGVSSQLSPISLRVNLGATGSSQAHMTTLICLFDAIIAVNVGSRQASVKV